MKNIRFALLLSALAGILLLGLSVPVRADFKKTKIAVLDFQMQGEQTN